MDIPRILLPQETVQFYTEDWKPYLGLDIFNHKESPTILSEMQQVMGTFTQESAVLRPGLERVREKALLSFRRVTQQLVEDAAYSLLGIFNASIPVIYGEGNRAVGRLLEHVPDRFGGRHDSCLDRAGGKL
ncbi:hypothetical protein J3R83DRAFT_5157 [Lanmaoa asiatica]|nr:hypothetical protein J3R83DRAFT_5157 [Lanmaoa asiatica]